MGNECAREHKIQPLPKDASGTTPWMEEVEQCRSNCRELGGTGESFSTLPGEISAMRVEEKAAEAVVAGKSWKHDGAKG